MNKRMMLVYVLGAGLVAYCSVGFFVGVTAAGNFDGLFENTIGRLMVGVIVAFTSILNGGFLPSSATNQPQVNLWPYIFCVWGVLLIPLIKNSRNQH